jgi:hypothetical protein
VPHDHHEEKDTSRVAASRLNPRSSALIRGKGFGFAQISEITVHQWRAFEGS